MAKLKWGLLSARFPSLVQVETSKYYIMTILHTLFIRLIKTCLVSENSSLFTKQQNFRHVQIENICRQQNNCISDSEISYGRVENIVGKGENAGY